MTEMNKQQKTNIAVNRLKLSEEPSLIKELLFLFAKIGAIMLVFVFMFTIMFGLFRSSDAAMFPAVKDGDLVMYYRLDKDYIAQDTLVLTDGGKKQVCRVIAVAGDTVDISEEGLLINGALQQETGIYSPTHRYQEGIEFPLEIQQEEIFVLGDNRLNSTDSRIYGAVRIKDTLGKVMTIFRWRNI